MSETVAHYLGDIRPFLDDKKLIELKANGPGVIALQNVKGEWRNQKVPSLTVDWWRQLARAVAISTGQTFDDRRPQLQAKLPGNHRLMLLLGANVIDPVTSGPGVAATIRLFRRGNFKLKDFGLPNDVAATIVAAVQRRENILVSGSTNAGKTSLTDLLCEAMTDAAPIYVEDTQELVPEQALRFHLRMNPAASDTNYSYQDLMSFLQMSSPDRIVLGELNVQNVTLTLRLFTMGQDGIITTLHANSARDTIASLAELLALNGFDRAYTESFFRGRIDLVIHCARLKDRRVVTEVMRPSRDDFETVWRNPDVD